MPARAVAPPCLALVQARLQSRRPSESVSAITSRYSDFAIRKVPPSMAPTPMAWVGSISPNDQLKRQWKADTEQRQLLTAQRLAFGRAPPEFLREPISIGGKLQRAGVDAISLSRRRRA